MTILINVCILKAVQSIYSISNTSIEVFYESNLVLKIQSSFIYNYNTLNYCFLTVKLSCFLSKQMKNICISFSNFNLNIQGSICGTVSMKSNVLYNFIDHITGLFYFSRYWLNTLNAFYYRSSDIFIQLHAIV